MPSTVLPGRAGRAASVGSFSMEKTAKRAKHTKNRKSEPASYRKRIRIFLTLVRSMGLEPIRLLTHAPQTCLSAYSSTTANNINILSRKRSSVNYYLIYFYVFCLFFSFLLSVPFHSVPAIFRTRRFSKKGDGTDGVRYELCRNTVPPAARKNYLYYLRNHPDHAAVRVVLQSRPVAGAPARHFPGDLLRHLWRSDAREPAMKRIFPVHSQIERNQTE